MWHTLALEQLELIVLFCITDTLDNLTIRRLTTATCGKNLVCYNTYSNISKIVFAGRIALRRVVYTSLPLKLKILFHIVAFFIYMKLF